MTQALRYLSIGSILFTGAYALNEKYVLVRNNFEIYTPLYKAALKLV